VRRYKVSALVAFIIAGIFLTLGLVEYGKMLGIEELLERQARQAGAAERCHTCPYETAQERAAFTNYSIVSAVIGASGIGLLVIDRRNIT
jgi:hypothetical protein